MKRSSVAQLSSIRELLTEIAGISLPPPSAGSLGMSRSALLKAELIKEAVLQFKLLKSTWEKLCLRLWSRISKMRCKFQPMPKSNSFCVLCMNSLD